ncbi:carbohydrate binding domain-containing protein [Colwellia sp. RE-S-Sl-9]
MSHITKKIVLASTITTALTSTLIIAQTPEPEAGKRWVLNAEFSDEFNGNTLDKTKWRNYHETWKGRVPAKFEPSAVSVSNGNMQIRNHKLAVPDGNYTIAGGAVQSITKNAYHGYYEARLKTSRINMSTTFWLSNGNEDLLSPNNVNADCDNDKWSMELDIAEAVGGVIDKEWGASFRNGQQYNTHVWYSDCSGNRQGFAKGVNVAEGDGSTPVNNKLPDGEEVWQNFNTFAAWWKNENDVQFYLNDNFSGKVKVSTALHNKPYSRPMGIQMLTETYNWATPYPTDDELSNDAINTSYYDWIRSYLYIGVNDDLPVKDSVLFTNSGFESGDFTAWSGWGGSPRDVVQTNVNTGTYAGHVVGGGAIEKVVTLLTNTEYTFSAYANVISGSLNFGAKTNNGDEISFGVTMLAVNDGYEKVTLTFNTGEQENIKLYWYAPNGSEFYVDDIKLDQIVPAPESVNNLSTALYTENFTIKNYVLTEDNLALAFLYQINQDRDAEIVVFDGNNEVTRKKITLKAGYGHYLTDIDLSTIDHLVKPVFEINLMPVGQMAILTSTGKVAIADSVPPAEIIPTLTLSKDMIADTSFKTGSGEQVVLKAILNSDAVGAQLHNLTFKAEGDINELNDVSSIKLYHDKNNNGVVDSDELLASGNYSADNGDITFNLNKVIVLPVGNTAVLLTYTF